MVLKSIFLLPVMGITALAADLSVKDLKVPEFDAQGRLTRILKADSAVGPLDAPKLQHGEVDFFRPAQEKSVRVGTLTFDEATYHRTMGVIDGKDLIHLDSPKGQITGKGFEYVLSTGHLKLISNVVLELPDAHVSGRTGEAVLKQAASGKDGFVSVAKIKGDVVLTGLHADKFKFDRAETDEAVYTEADGMLVLTSPVTAWTGTDKSVIEAGQLKVYVGHQPNQALEPTRPAVTPFADAKAAPAGRVAHL